MRINEHLPHLRVINGLSWAGPTHVYLACGYNGLGIVGCRPINELGQVRLKEKTNPQLCP